MVGENNVSSPISTLPAELLIHIFKSFLAAAASPPEAPCVKIDKSPLLCLTGVCHRWRDVAIGYPAFWTTMDNNNMAQLDEFARRSRDLPLTMFLTVEEQIEDARTILSCLGERISRLSLTLLRKSFDISTLLKCIRTDHLECLTVAFDVTIRFQANWGQPVSICYYPLGNPVSNGLSALALRPVAPWLPTDHFPSLTHLYLSVNHTLKHVSQPMVIKLLKQMPQLEFLHLKCSEGFGQGASGDHKSIATLPRLRSCTFVGGELNPYFPLLSNLSLPQDVWVRVSDTMPDPFESESEPILLPPLLVVDQVTHAEAALRDRDQYFIAEGPTGGIWFDTYIDDPGADRWDRWTSCFLETLPRLTSLNVSISDSAGIRGLLNNAPELVHLGIRLPFHWRIDALDGDWEPHDAAFTDVFECLGREKPLVCPDLQTLALDVIHVHMRKKIPREDHSGEGPGTGTRIGEDGAMYDDADEKMENGGRGLGKSRSMLVGTRRANLRNGPDKGGPHSAEGVARAILEALVGALSARTEAGKPVKRLVYQDWVTEDQMAYSPSYSAHLAKISEFLRTGTKDYIGDFKVPPPNELAAPFVLRDCWRMEAAEKYWMLQGREVPYYSPLF